MFPEIDLGPITLQTFGLVTALAFIAGGWIVALRLRELGAPADWAYEIALAAGVGGLLGAKLWFALEEGNWSLGQLFSGTGLVWYGGALGGAAAVGVYARWRRILNATLFDMCSPALAAGYAIGRIACQLSGDGDYGKPTDAWWGMGYPDGTVPTPPGVDVQPAPVFEALAMAVVAALLWRWRDRFKPGVLFGAYLLFSSTERFLIEFVRRNEPVAAGLTLAQVVSVAMALVGAAVVVSLNGRAAAKARLLPAE